MSEDEGATRTRLLACAMRLFGELGYAATTVAQIEQAAGLSPGSGGLYRHFRSKQDLLSQGLDALLASSGLTAALGAAARPVGGADGPAGRADGPDGPDGTDGADGAGGADGPGRADGAGGVDGADEADRADGAGGADGASGVDGADDDGGLQARLQAVAAAGLARMEQDKDLSRLLFRGLDAFPGLMARFRDGEIRRNHEAVAGLLERLAAAHGGQGDWPAVAAVLAGAVAHYWVLRDLFGSHPAGISEQRYTAAAASLAAALLGPGAEF